MKKAVIFTAGACLGNPGPGGYGVVLQRGIREKRWCGGAARTTNPRMVLTAAIAGLSRLKTPCSVEVFSNSEYLIKGMTQWVHNWTQTGWKNSSGDTVSNRDLWKRLIHHSQKHYIRWTRTGKHDECQRKESCDRIAERAAVYSNKARRWRRWGPVSPDCLPQPY